jgi:cytohesin
MTVKNCGGSVRRTTRSWHVTAFILLSGLVPACGRKASPAPDPEGTPNPGQGVVFTDGLDLEETPGPHPDYPLLPVCKAQRPSPAAETAGWGNPKRPDSQLLAAAADGDEAAVDRLLTAGTDPNTRDDRGGTALHFAAISGHLSVVKRLCHAPSIDLRRGDAKNVHAVHLAAWKGHAEIAVWLLRHSAEFKTQQLVDTASLVPITKIRDVNEWTVLQYAAAANRIEVVKKLLDTSLSPDELGDIPIAYRRAVLAGSSQVAVWLTNNRTNLVPRGLEMDHVEVQAADASGLPPIHQAAAVGNDEAVRALHDSSSMAVVACPAVGNAQPIDRITPLHLAALNGHPQVVRLFVARAGVDTPVAASDSNGLTPLHYAAGGRRPETVSVLLAAGAVWASRGSAELTPLEVAVYTDDVATLTAFEAHIGRDALIAARGEDEKTLLHRAAAWGRLRAATWLLDHNAPSFVRSGGGNTPLHEAVGGGHGAIARLLIDRTPEGERDAFLAASGANSLTALHLAAATGRVGQIELLVRRSQSRARLLAGGDSPLSPLLLAAASEQAGSVATLLKLGADPKVETLFGYTALHVAALRGDVATAEALLKAGVAPNIRGRFGETPLHAVTINRHHSEVDQPIDFEGRVGRKLAVAKLLVARGADRRAKSAAVDRGETANPLQFLPNATPGEYLREFGSPSRELPLSRELAQLLN